VDGIWLGLFNAGLTRDGFASSLALGIDEALRFVPCTRVENACASGSAAIQAARHAIMAGEARVALVIGAEKMTEVDTAGATHALMQAATRRRIGARAFPRSSAASPKAIFRRTGMPLLRWRGSPPRTIGMHWPTPSLTFGAT
jgi:acetyl-CoA C-acetyltransferase